MYEPPREAKDAIQSYGLSLDAPLVSALSAYLDALLEANAAFNLTAITDPSEAWIKHLADSLSLAPDLASLAPGRAFIDVGSGGGLPGLPLAIAFPQHRFSLLEATGKKARFLSDTAARLGLTNVRVVNERAEDFGRGKGRGRFDVATSRAVSRLPVLLELTLPLVHVNGLSLAIKGGQAEQEVTESKRALELLRGRVRSLRRTPTGTVVCVEKTAETPARYPRRAGEPKRSPL